MPVFQCVVDCSVGAMLYIADPLSPRADALFAHLSARKPGIFHVPDLFYPECLSVMRKHMLRYGYSTLVRDAAALCALALRVTPSFEMTNEAAAITVSCGISPYDAFYVALAGRVGAPLITADDRLVRAMAGSAYDVQSLAVFTIPALP